MGTFAQRSLLASTLGLCGSPVPITRDAAFPEPLFTLAQVLGHGMPKSLGFVARLVNYPSLYSSMLS